eukprot:COSAG02_NODE_13458_length_1392_cov_2.312452_2_plen_72_part_00
MSPVLGLQIVSVGGSVRVLVGVCGVCMVRLCCACGAALRVAVRRELTVWAAARFRVLVVWLHGCFSLPCYM